jgi:hypothetical protein
MVLYRLKAVYLLTSLLSLVVAEVVLMVLVVVVLVDIEHLLEHQAAVHQQKLK